LSDRMEIGTRSGILLCASGPDPIDSLSPGIAGPDHGFGLMSVAKTGGAYTEQLIIGKVWYIDIENDILC
jgi:hypothetical protein